MSRLIDADALFKRITSTYDYVPIDVLEMIEGTPTIEAEPVRRGKWEKAQPKYPWAKESRKSFCSLCGNWGRKSFKYCPHCGARMDSEVE